MTASDHPTTAVSAPGKVLLAGGYLVTDRDYTGLVFGLDARINVVAQPIPTSQGVQLTEIVVESPQFVGGSWRYGYHLASDDGGITVTQLQVGSTISTNSFIETALTYALTYISRVSNQRPTHSFEPARLTILADSSYYSAPDPDGPDEDPSSSSSSSTTTTKKPSPSSSRFIHMRSTIANAKKTGLGSSAALVTSLTAALLAHYLPPTHFDPTTDRGRATLHNLAQTAHCRAQGKIGSGFDVAAAVYGGCLYRRFSPALLDAVPAPGQPAFGAKLQALVDSTWDTEVRRDDAHAAAGLLLPRGVAVRMCDVACGSQTPGMVRAVAAWRARDPGGARALWDELQRRNEALAGALAAGRLDELPGALRGSRELAKRMGAESGVPVEPDSQTELLDALGGVDGVYGGVVPGAGGFDAVAVLVRDDEDTARRLEAFLEAWSRDKGAKVKLLSVRGELEGVRTEKLSEFEGWL